MPVSFRQLSLILAVPELSVNIRVKDNVTDCTYRVS